MHSKLALVLAAVAASAALMAPAAASAGAAPIDQPVSRGTLASKTVIKWSGLKSIVLATTVDELRLRHDDPDAPRMRIRHTGGFAMALVQSRWQPPVSACGFAMCHSNYLADIRQGDRGYGIAGGVHEGHLSPKGFPVDVYLLSDGPATLTIEPEGVTSGGTREYRAGGTFRGALRKLPVFCPTLGCDPGSGYLDGYAFGGSTYDVGPLGLAGAFAYSESEPAPHVSSARACMYPNRDSPQASSDPSAHPDGCDLPGGDSDLEEQTGELVTEGLLTAQPHPGDAHWYVHLGVGGPRYLGYRAKSLGPFAKMYGGYGVWIRYGIDGDDPDTAPDPGTTPRPPATTPSPPGTGTGRDVRIGAAEQPGASPQPGCADRAAPRSAIRSAGGARGRLRIVGLASDSGCRASVKHVEVAVARRVGGRCRFLRADSRLAGARPCSQALFVRARGTSTWRFERRLPAGRYEILSRATDAAGNVEGSLWAVTARVGA